MPTPTRNTRNGNLKQRKHGLGKTNKTKHLETLKEFLFKCLKCLVFDISW